MRVLLRTDRITLRELVEEDAGRLYDLDRDPEVTRYVGGPSAPDVAGYLDRFRTVYRPYYAAHPWRGGWAAEVGGAFVGWFIARPAPDHRLSAELGWTNPDDIELGYRLRREVWGRGLATEGALALVKLAAADPATTAVVACALVTNGASCRVLEKCGLVKVGEVALPGFDDPVAKFVLGGKPCST